MHRRSKYLERSLIAIDPELIHARKKIITSRFVESRPICFDEPSIEIHMNVEAASIFADPISGARNS